MQNLIDRETTLDLTFVEEPYLPPRCEGPSHPELKYGHGMNEAAAWTVVFPCGAQVLMCHGWVQARFNESRPEEVRCNVQCGQLHPTTEIRFTRL